MLHQTFAVCCALAWRWPLAVSSASEPGVAQLPDCSCANGAHAACLSTAGEWWTGPAGAWWAAWPLSPCARLCLDGAGEDGRTAGRLVESTERCMADYEELVQRCALEQTRKGENGCARDDWQWEDTSADRRDMGHEQVDAALATLYGRIDYMGCMGDCDLPDTGKSGGPYAVPFAEQCGCFGRIDSSKCERQVAGEKYAGAMPICACVAEAVPEAGLECSLPPPPPPACDCANATQAACVRAQRLPAYEPPPTPPPPPCYQRCVAQTPRYGEIELLERAADKCHRRHEEAVADCMNRKINEGNVGCAKESDGPPPTSVQVPNGGDTVWAHRWSLESSMGLPHCLEHERCYGRGMLQRSRRSVADAPAPQFQPPFVEECGCHAQLDYAMCESEQPPHSICHCVAEEVDGLDCK